MTGIDWKEIATMMGVLSGVSAAVQYLLTRLIIQPQISSAIEKVNQDSQKWAAAQFPSRNDFNLHVAKDEAHNDSVKSLIQDVVFDQSKTAERVATLHDKVIVLESARRGV